MSERISVNVHGPKPREIDRITAVLVRGGLIAYPTDSGYALGWRTDNRQARDRVIRLRGLNRNHHFTFCCRSLSDVGQLTQVNNQWHRMIRGYTPGPYTFILPATKQVPKRLQHPRRRTIGIRVPTHPIPRALLDEMGEPLLSSTMQLPGDDHPLTQGLDIYERVRHEVDVVIDGGPCGLEPTSVVDLVGPYPEVVRSGMGNVDHLLSA